MHSVSMRARALALSRGSGAQYGTDDIVAGVERVHDGHVLVGLEPEDRQLGGAVRSYARASVFSFTSRARAPQLRAPRQRDAPA